MTESLVPVSPGFEAPLEMLETCHERLHAQLGTLDRLARWLPEHGADQLARRAAAAIIRYFDVAAVNHHMDEELDLIPLLRQRVDTDRRFPLESLIEWILEDHQRMFAAWDVMRAKLERVSKGEVVDLTLDEVHAFTERYALHTEREEGELFPYARALLTAEDLARIGQSMTNRRRQPSC
ncbi:hemerythrin domain-containing protein [Rhodocyclaceae bacterium SMB388]